MNVASTNPFALLPDNVANSDVAASNSAAKKKQQQAPKQQAKTANKPAAPAVPTTTVPGGRGAPRRTVVREAAADSPAFGTNDKTDPRSARPPQRGRGGSVRGRGRQFDRHSGTGLVDSEKKEKQGWLGDNAAVVADGEKAAEEAQKDSQDGTATPAAEEPEEVVKTLDDYLKERNSNKVDAKRTLRKANEGVDKSQLKNSVALEKVEEDFFAPQVAPKARKQKERKEKIHVDIEQRFVDEQRRGAFRNTRNGPRTNDRRGPRQNRININDERDFPSL